MARLPGPPPTIPGFHFLTPLGSGGFADVYLYEQDMPRRKVAVKVLHEGALENTGTQVFVNEANAMAALSTHPSILTIYHASISADGRPYFVLEYAKESMGKRFREEYLPVDEVVATGVQMGSALESVHRSHLLHRDIKPSNILLNEYGNPLLSDFGIVGGRDEQGGESIALSVPWSAPEVVTGESVGSVATEVWSLGATLYALLAGRSPFEAQAGQSNADDALKKRIAKAKYTPIGRGDVPVELEGVLAKAMAKKPSDRYHSVEQMVGDLQNVQRLEGWPVTEYLLSPVSLSPLSGETQLGAGSNAGLPVRSEVATSSGRSRVARPQKPNSSSTTDSAVSHSELTKRQVALAIGLAIFGTAVIVVAAMMWWGGPW